MPKWNMRLCLLVCLLLLHARPFLMRPLPRGHSKSNQIFRFSPPPTAVTPMALVLGVCSSTRTGSGQKYQFSRNHQEKTPQQFQFPQPRGGGVVGGVGR
jgi:hypothetical protein